MVARLWLLTLEFADIMDEALDSSSTKSSMTVTVTLTLSRSLAVLVRMDEDDDVGLRVRVHALLGADDKDANASTQIMRVDDADKITPAAVASRASLLARIRPLLFIFMPPLPWREFR